jgi:phosphosulfolactate phosphohydrolase-like enzyme
LKAGLDFLMNKERVIEGAQKATAWVQGAIAVIKTSPDNPFGDDDEAIAGEILKRLKERR